MTRSDDPGANLLPDLPERLDDPVARLRWYAAVARHAPSKHNTQPWTFVVREDGLEVWTDPARALPETDPRGREATLSCGAAVQLACVAARALGRQPSVTVLPDGPQGPVARLTDRVERTPLPEDAALLEAVPVRRTDRGPLDSGPLPPTLPFRLQAAAAAEGARLRLVTGPGERDTLALLVAVADRLLVRRGRVDEELASWVRTGVGADDGVPADHTRGAAGSYRAPFVQRDFGTPGTAAAQDRPGVDDPLVAVLCTPRDTPADWVAAGRALAAVLLLAATEGAAASYLNQPVEHAETRSRLREQLSLDGVPQLVLRLGVGGPVGPTPRRGVDEVVREQTPQRG